MKSILFLIECLDQGGAETIITNIVSNLSPEKFKTTVFSKTDNEFYTETIKQYAKHKSFAHQGENFSKARCFINKFFAKLAIEASPNFVRRLMIRGRYDVEIAFCEGYSTKIIGNSGKRNCKKIAWVHTDVINYPWSEAVFGSAEEEKKCYENFDAIICVSQTMREAFRTKYGMDEKLHVLYNPIDFNKVIEKSKEEPDFELGNGMKFVLAGSFKKVKAYDRFVSVCQKLKEDGYEFSVLIMGSGFEKNNIRKAVRDNHLDDYIKIASFQSNPYKYIAHSDVFVCASYAEGYSTAVSEAVALSVPVITTECSGMREIFGENECGIICENSEDGLYSAMKKVLENPSLLEKFSAEEKKRANDFSLQKRVKAIEDFLESV